MFNSLCVVSVTKFSGTSTPDKNGKYPVMLQIIAGKAPNRNVLSGTVAENSGLEVGKSYLVQCREQGTDKEFGTDYSWIKVSELSGLDIIKTSKEIGAAEVFAVDRPKDFDYERKGVPVIGARSLRIKEGQYTPANQQLSGLREIPREKVK